MLPMYVALNALRQTVRSVNKQPLLSVQSVLMRHGEYTVVDKFDSRSRTFVFPGSGGSMKSASMLELPVIQD